MWTDKTKFRTIIKIVLILMAIALAVAFFLIYSAVSGKTQQTDAELLEVYEQHQLEQQEERLATVAEVNAEYAKDMETVSQYLPGIVCWGDSITAGSENGTSFPSTLQSLINKHICSIYDFRSTIENADDITRVEWDEYTVEIPVVNLGGGGEDCNTILGRNGAEPFQVYESFTIPADTEPVEVRMTGHRGDTVKPLVQNDGGTNSVTIAGVEGTLSLYNYGSGSYRKYIFTRNEAGEAVEVPEGEKIVTSASNKYKDYVSVICIGTYGGYDSIDDLIEKINAIRDNRTANRERYIVIGIYAQEEGYFCDFSTLETRMQSEFGEHYINLRKYLLSDAMKDAGISPTSQDQARMNVGDVPYSMLASRSSVELTATGYRLLGGLVYDRMESLGYFDEVVDELGLEDTRKELQDAGKYTPRNQ